MREPSVSDSISSNGVTDDRCYPPIERRPATFDPALLQALLDGEYAVIRNQVKERITRPDFRYHEGTSVASYRRQVLDWAKKVAEMGIGRLFMSRAVGGEADPRKFIAALETLAFHDTSLVIKIGVQFGLFAGTIQLLGTEYHHKKYLADAATMKVMGCFAMTEIGHGSNVYGLETVAVYQPEQNCFVIQTPRHCAGKNFVGNAAADGRLAVVFAQLVVSGKKHGLHAFVVPIRDDSGASMPGVTITDNGTKIGLNGVDNGQIWFDQVKVPRTELLNRLGEVTADGQYRSRLQNDRARFFAMLATLIDGRIAIAVTANSAAKSALTIATRYAARRRQFGPPHSDAELLLLDYPAHQRRLCPLIANAYALDFALKHLIAREESTQRTHSRLVESLAAGLKAVTAWNAIQTIQVCREACGGEGYLAINRIGALKADTDIHTTFEGDNTVLMQLVAKNLLSEFKEKLSEMRPAQMAGFFVDHRFSTLVKRSPSLTLEIRERHLRDAHFHLEMFKFRESVTLFSVAGDFHRLTARKRMDLFTAFTQLQRKLLDLAHAHIERVILEQFVNTVEKAEPKSLKPVLKRMCDLFALSQIERYKGWYFEQGAMTGFKSRAISRQVDKLCAEVRQEAVQLVDAFGIPDSCIAAPIAL